MGRIRPLAIAVSIQVLARLGLLLGLSGLIAVSPILVSNDYHLAYADDDDGGDDDDDDDDNDGGPSAGSSAGPSSNGSSASSRSSGSGLFKKLFGKAPRKKVVRQRKAARATATRPKAVALPQYRNSEIVAIGLSVAEIETLTTRGYVVIERVAVASVDAEMARLSVPRGVSLDTARTEVRAINAAAVADFNHFYRPQNDEACDGEACASWALLQWPISATAGTVCGEGVRIGMVDTTVNIEHSSLNGKTIEIIETSRPDAIDASAGHGTAVAALLVGSRVGRAPGLLPSANLVAADPFERTGSDDRSDTFAVVSAIDKVAARNVDAINLSFAGPDNDLLEKIVNVVSVRGVPLIAAAGNAGAGSPPLYPAGYSAAIAVTAIDRNKNIYRRAVRGDHIDFAAPGVNIWAAASVSGGKPKTGTSFATPFVTAAAALIKSAKPQASTQDVVAALSANSLDLGEPDKDKTFGNGLIQTGELCATEPDPALQRAG